VLPVPASHHEVVELGEWHDAQHGGEADTLHGDEEEAPAGIVVLVPLLPAAAPEQGSATFQPASYLPAAVPACGWHLDAVESTYRTELCRSGWPPQRGGRSGVAALLRSSHAILI
jgi:hypothetical protein